MKCCRKARLWARAYCSHGQNQHGSRQFATYPIVKPWCGITKKLQWTQVISSVLPGIGD